MANLGLDKLPFARVPDKWDREWFIRFCREVLALADTRNAIEGEGVTITGGPDVPATISASPDVLALVNQPYVLATASAFLPNERILTGQAGYLTVTDAGPGGAITVGINPSGLPYDVLQMADPFSVLGNPSDSVLPLAPIAASVNDTIFRRVGDALDFGQLTVGMAAGTPADNDVLAVVAGVPTWSHAITPTWTGQHNFTAGLTLANVGAKFNTDTDAGLRYDGTFSATVLSGPSGDGLWLNGSNIYAGERFFQGASGGVQYSFQAAQDTGFGLFSAGRGQFVADGVQTASFTSAAFTINVPLQMTILGNAGAPTYSWDAKPTDGMYYDGFGPAFTVGGTFKFGVQSALVYSAVPLWFGASGNAGTPMLTFDGDTNTGIYRAAADTLGFTTGGVLAFQFGPLGQLGIGGATYGTAGQVLTSGGAVGVPTWATPTSGATGANPTASVGLAAVNGVATTFLRSDGAPALDVGISPTWSGTHRFNNGFSIDTAPFGWGNLYKSLDFSAQGASFVGSGYALYLTVNTYNDNANWKRIGASFGTSQIISFDGGFEFYGDTAGTAGGTYTPTLRISFTKDGRLFGTALHNNSGAVTGTTNQYVASGTYTPTLTGVTNVSSTTARVCQWMRVGNVVTVSGSASITTTAAVATQCGISLPIASAIANQFEVAGGGGFAIIAGGGVFVIGDATNDRAEAQFLSNAIGASVEIYFTFTYLVK